MNKKEVIIIVVSGIVSILLGFFVTYFLMSNMNKESKISAGKYSLNYGTYKGTAEEYDPDTKKTNKNELKIEITKDKIKSDSGEKSYTVKGEKIYVDDIVMYEVTGNNKFIMLVGSGVEFIYEK